MIPLPRPLLAILAIGVAGYTATTGVLDLADAPHPARVVVALALFVVCFVLTLVGRGTVMSPLVSGLNAGSGLAMALLCVGGADGTDVAGHWYIGSVGCLLVLTMLKRRPAHAWVGAGLVFGQTLVQTGWSGAVSTGAAAMVLWVSAAWFGVRSLSHAMRDIQQFARSEREAVEWQAAQDAHHFERQVRLTQTSRVALPMLRRIVEVEGDLDDADRQECRVLEQTIRDEIRGRRLLNEAMRDQVIAHRRRGAFVQVLDDGGLDDIDPALMDPILDRAAEAISHVHSDRIIIRTAPKGSDKSVTVVAISIDETAAALGLEDEGEEVDLWLELPRPENATLFV